MIPGLTGEDPNSKDRQQRQREQLQHWLIQQQAERQGQRHKFLFSDKNYDRFMVEVNNMALELQNLEMENRKAKVIATKDFNLAMVSQLTIPHCYMEHCKKKQKNKLIYLLPTFKILLCLYLQRQKLSDESEERDHSRVRIDSARTATLIERQQAKLNKQMRKHLDSTNLMLAETRKQLKPDISKGAVTESFFSQFNTCSR
uniref:Uncharacterized protein n=1 Tax=Periophthalmus magnuspinnatus TaxID=409849 RepID=A0A3B3Z910_9GOBI